VGVNVTFIEQLVPGSREAPQLLAWVKSPDAVMDVMWSGAPPELLKVTVCAALVVLTSWLVKVNADGLTLATGATPVPKRDTMGLPALLNTSKKPRRVPVAVGWKVTLMVQEAP